MRDFTTEAFSQFDKKWALVCAGTLEDHNAMTVSWGGLGTLWGKPVATVYVKPVRHTYEYMERSDYFTVSFYPEACRRSLSVMGTRSGRDTDKDAVSGLTAVALDHGVTYAQAEATLLCRKIYRHDLDTAHMPRDVVETYYQTEAPHRMYVGEVVEIIGE